MKYEEQQAELHPKIVLGIAAHPDDLDFSASGTMAKFIEAGAEVHYVIMTDGSKGSDRRDQTSEQLIAMRQSEQRAAADILGAKSVTFLDYVDGELEVSMQAKKDIVREIRRLKPDTIITMDPSMLYNTELGMINHSDHRAAGQITLDAAFPLARDHMAFPELEEDGLPPHKVATLLLVNFDTTLCSYFVDVAEFMQQKKQAFLAHTSQIGDTDSVAAIIESVARKQGAASGYDFAESFVRIDIR